MITVSLLGMDYYLAIEATEKLHNALLSIYRIKDEDLIFFAPDSFLIHDGIEQTSFRLNIKVEAPIGYEDKEREVRDYLIDRVLNEIPYCRLNGHRTDRLPNNANFSFQFVEGESLLIKLDMKGICGSSGSACTSGSLDPSHVLLAIGLPHEIAHGSLRLTLNEEIEKEDIDYVVDNLKEIVAHLREMSPLYEDFIKKQGEK